jgi:uncharacterized membrane protein YeaQ/YmgE (transglycosylase-associated protein family)
MTGLFIWIIIGSIAGFLATVFFGGTGFGIVGDVILGILGGLLGGFLASTFTNLSITAVHLSSILVAVAGAVMLLSLFRALHWRPAG